MAKKPFWERKSLQEMTKKEWESLCDGCARCCLLKLEDEDTGEFIHTNVVCRLLDLETCQCTDYKNRSKVVPTCIKVTAKNAGSLGWMPPTCAYRRLAEGRDLAWWHPLVSGDEETVHLAGISVRNRVISESEIDDDDLEDYETHWPAYDDPGEDFSVEDPE